MNGKERKMRYCTSLAIPGDGIVLRRSRSACEREGGRKEKDASGSEERGKQTDDWHASKNKEMRRLGAQLLCWRVARDGIVRTSNPFGQRSVP